jgi:hypothetical protein
MIEFKILQTVDKAQVGNYQHFTNEFIFGSAEGDMIIDDPDISEQQARIYAEGTEFFIESIDTAAVVKLNSQPISGPTPIKAKDNIAVGHTTIQMTLLDPNPIKPPERFVNPNAGTRFAAGSKEEALLKVLEFLGGAAPQDTPPPLPQGMPKPPPLPK